MIHTRIGEAAVTPRNATACERSVHHICICAPITAPHNRIAFSSIASNTGARLPGDALITRSTSAVAVCCSSASRCLCQQARILHGDHCLCSELSSSAISFSENGRTSRRNALIQPSKLPSLRSGTHSPVRRSALSSALRAISSSGCSSSASRLVCGRGVHHQ